MTRAGFDLAVQIAFGEPVSHPRNLVPVQLVVQLPANVYPGRQHVMAQELESLPPTGEIQNGFLALDFSLVKIWLFGHLGSKLGNRRVFLLSFLSPSFLPSPYPCICLLKHIHVELKILKINI